MKSTRYISPFVSLILIMLSSCETKTSKGIDIDSMVGAIPVQTDINGRWGMMDVNGHLIFENEFVDQPTMAVNGLFSVSENGALSLYAIGDQPKLVGACEGMSNIGICNDGLVPVSNGDGPIAVVGTDGVERFRIGAINGKEIVGCSSLFNDGLLVVTDTEGLMGCVDTNGKTAIAPKYAKLSDFNDGYAIAFSDAAYKVIDRQDKVKCSVKKGYEVVSDEIIDAEFVIADSASHLCFMNIDGVISKLPAKVKRVGDYTKDIFAFQAENQLWGLMSRDDGNATLMRPKFRSLTILRDEDKYLVDLDGHWSIIDIRGKTAIDLGDAYSDIKVLNLKGAIRYFAKDNVGWTLLDEAGREIFTDFNIYNVGFDTTIGETPKASGTLPTERIADMLLEMVSPNGLCGIQLNTIANRWYSNQSPDDFADSNEFEPDSVPKAPAGCEYTLIGVTDRVIAAGMRFNAVTQKVEYAFLPNNTINAVELDVTTPITGVYGKIKDQMVEALKQKGYRLIEDGDDGVLLQSHYANLELTPTENDKAITVIIYRL